MLVHLPASGEIKGQSGPSDKEESSSPLVEAKPDNLTSKLDLEDSTSDKSSLDSSLDGLVWDDSKDRTLSRNLCSHLETTLYHLVFYVWMMKDFWWTRTHSFLHLQLRNKTKSTLLVWFYGQYLEKAIEKGWRDLLAEFEYTALVRQVQKLTTKTRSRKIQTSNES